MSDSTGTVHLGPKVDATHDGQRVSFVVDGVITKYDRATGIYTVRGNSRGAQHIEWEFEVHWSTEFHSDAVDERRVDPKGCGCTDCLLGDSLPIGHG